MATPGKQFRSSPFIAPWRRHEGRRLSKLVYIWRARGTNASSNGASLFSKHEVSWIDEDVCFDWYRPRVIPLCLLFEKKQAVSFKSDKSQEKRRISKKGTLCCCNNRLSCTILKSTKRNLQLVPSNYENVSCLELNNRTVMALINLIT